MSSKIILSTDAIIACPNCGNKFPIEQCITRQTIKQYEEEYQTILDNSLKEFEKQLSKQNEKRITQLKEDTESKLKLEFEEERKSYKNELEEKNSKIKLFRENELKLIKAQNKLEEEKQNFELQKAKDLIEAKKEIEKKIIISESQKYELKEAEYKKQLGDAIKESEELKHKLEQRSSQLQGEVLELEVEKALRESFTYDDIKDVAKGERGADILQCVCTQSGLVCGTIIWETKRAKNWQDKWLQKVKDDCISAKADIPVIVSTCLPKEYQKEIFAIVDGVWICRKEIVRPVAEALRMMLISNGKIKLQNLQSEGRSRKADLIYNYLESLQFTQNLRSIFETFRDMREDIDRERNNMNKTLKKREVQLERVAVSMSSMIGTIVALAPNSFPELNTIPQLQLPGENDS